MELALGILVGVVLAGGIGAAFLLRDARRHPHDLSQPVDAQADATAHLLDALRPEIAALQRQALEHNTDQFLSLAQSRLQAETARGDEQLRARGDAIEKGLLQVNRTLASVTEYVQKVDTERSQSIVSLATAMEESRRAMRELSDESRRGVKELSTETARLTSALTGGQTRGQWGERMAEDVLRVAGLREGINYRKNRQVEGGGRPDYTFLLPQQRLLHMDVKFPLAGYLRYLDAGTDPERATAARQFLADVRRRVREVTTRDYINPAAGTLDYMLVFIPNEQVYAFIHDQDASIADDALRRRVVLCSPLTLFAVLAVIRQSVETMRLEQHAHEILATLSGFEREWEKYQESVEKVGRTIERSQRAFDDLAGTRTRQLQRKLDKVETLRAQAGGPADQNVGSDMDTDPDHPGPEASDQGALVIPDHYRLPAGAQPDQEPIPEIAALD